MGKYRIYIDEVGNADLESSDDPNHRFLSLTGVVLDLNYVNSVVHPQMEELKSNYFESHPDEPVVFHRKETVNAKDPFRALRSPQTRERFDHQLLSLLSSWEYTVISVCIDKKRYKETYATWRYDPYHYCLAVLIERFVFFLDQRHARGDAMAESRGGKVDMRLKDSFARLWELGSQYVAPQRFHETLTSKQLKVKPKLNNISGLQLADMLAHPSRNEILRDHGLLDKPLGTFGAKIVRILQEKYYQRGGTIEGCGKKLL